jgi:8-oxo-dGTP pyrophosphatase MutT (NUDIX family)
MNRELLLRLLQAYKPSPEEAQFKIDTLQFIKNHTNCFERTLEIGHITASAWLVSKDHSHALLLHHKKLNRWLQLGGHCDGNPDVVAVAIKEAQEESGIQGIVPVVVEPAIFDIDIHWIPDHKSVKGHWHYDIRFLLHVVTDEQVVQNHESNELRWISKDVAQLPTQEPSIMRMFKKWIDLV